MRLDFNNKSESRNFSCIVDRLYNRTVIKSISVDIRNYLPLKVILISAFDLGETLFHCCQKLFKILNVKMPCELPRKQFQSKALYITKPTTYYERIQRERQWSGPTHSLHIHKLLYVRTQGVLRIASRVRSVQPSVKYLDD